MNNQEFTISFPYPIREDELRYYKEDAIRALGVKLGDLLKSGDRFTVRMGCDEPPSWVVEQYKKMPYTDPPECRYWLEIGAVHEREVVFGVMPQIEIGLPPASIKATPGREMVADLARRAFGWAKYFTAEAREREIEQFNKWMGS